MYAAIDIGTNSVRLLIGKVEKGRVIPITRAINSTRLGENINRTKLLKKEAIERTVNAIKEFENIIKQYPVKDLKIIATSAARDAKNSNDLINAFEKIDCKINIIFGQEEAYLSFKGAITAHSKIKNPVVIDIGGGSTELIYLNEKQEFKYTSTNIGAVRCKEDCWNNIRMLETLKPVSNKIGNLSEINLIGVGGTITSLAAIEQELDPYNPDKVQGYTLYLDNIINIYNKLAKLSLKERKKVLGLKPERADIILVGMDILIVIMKELNKNSIVVSESDLLDKIILDLAKDK